MSRANINEKKRYVLRLHTKAEGMEDPGVVTGIYALTLGRNGARPTTQRIIYLHMRSGQDAEFRPSLPNSSASYAEGQRPRFH
jgi:hypothetical protein